VEEAIVPHQGQNKGDNSKSVDNEEENGCNAQSAQPRTEYVTQEEKKILSSEHKSRAKSPEVIWENGVGSSFVKVVKKMRFAIWSCRTIANQGAEMKPPSTASLVLTRQTKVKGIDGAKRGKRKEIH